MIKIGFLIFVAIFLKFLIGEFLLLARAADAEGAAQEKNVYLPIVAREESNLILTRLVNAPYINGDVRENIYETGVFWFGQVTTVENYIDVRVGYNDSELLIHTNIFDRYLWYDLEPAEDDLVHWDAVSVFIDLDETPEDQPGVTSYRFIAQLNNWEAREDYQSVSQGNGAAWEVIHIPFITDTIWRGEGLNDSTKKAHGWTAIFTIPFASLGYSAPPDNAVWRLGLALHDRDDSVGTPIPEKSWPESFATDNPTTWGRLHFGLPTYHSTAEPDGVVTIRHGVNGVVVEDGHVGGAFNCGDGISHFSEWGNMNYESVSPNQVNIQNQWDVADWPCFSKYYISVPLDDIPSGSEIVSATITMYHFGNSGIGYTPGPQPSLIQVLTTIDEWEDTTITWNNAPLAYENIGRTYVEPLLSSVPWPGIPIQWDISKAVNDAHQLGRPLELVFYSADAPRHSGKYFYSSNSNSTGGARPIVTIYWSSP